LYIYCPNNTKTANFSNNLPLIFYIFCKIADSIVIYKERIQRISIKSPAGGFIISIVLYLTAEPKSSLIGEIAQFVPASQASHPTSSQQFYLSKKEHAPRDS